MRVLVAFAVLVVIPRASVVGAELTDGQAKVDTEPQTAEPPPARGLSASASAAAYSYERVAGPPRPGS